MNPFEIWAVHPGVARLGSTLLHFVWQGAAIGTVYAIARKRASAPNVRYLLACAALAAMAAAPVVTWWMTGPTAGAVSGPAAVSVPVRLSNAVRSAPNVRFVSISSDAAAPLLPWVVAVWLAGAASLWVRLIGGWIFAARLRTRLVRRAPAAWQQLLDRLRHRMRVSVPVQLLLSPLVEAPAVVGWIRPVVLAPVGALANLSAEQMEALLLHELAHIRRYDYLVNMLQSAVETLLFYHPAVWWVSGHMRAERELCCDDAAVAATGDALLYARALAELSTLCRPVVMAANGGALAHRIGRLLGKPRPAPRTWPGTGSLAAALLPVIAAVAMFGQSGGKPKFEVASIKPDPEQGNTGLRLRPGGLTANGPLKVMMIRAYGVQSFQIAGGPEWTNSERYAVDAKAAGNPGREQVSLMLQSLLEDRFQLKVHRETRELPVFNLVIARGGPKLSDPKENGCIEGDAPPLPNGGRMPVPGSVPTPVARCGGLTITLEKGGVRMFGGKIAMAEIAKVLAPTLGRMVIDRTGITRLFDVDLHFVPDDTTALLPPPPPDGAASEPLSPPIFSALSEQLGLRLESAKGPVEVIVIDHVERPTAN